MKTVVSANVHINISYFSKTFFDVCWLSIPIFGDGLLPNICAVLPPPKKSDNNYRNRFKFTAFFLSLKCFTFELDLPFAVLLVLSICPDWFRSLFEMWMFVFI